MAYSKQLLCMFLILISMTVFSALPKMNGWYAGDAHVHTSFGTTEWESPDSFQSIYSRAKSFGLDWIMFSEHSVAFDKGTQSYTQEINACRQNNSYGKPLCIVGQEFSLYAGSSKQQHYLGFPTNSFSLPYINGVCNDPFQLSNCRDAQEVIDEINSANGMGFIAHPFHQGEELAGIFQELTFFDWVSWGVDGYTGLEIFNPSHNGGNWDVDDQEAFAKWIEILLEEKNPIDGFAVGIANSDAHHMQEIGKGFTYCYMNTLTIENTLEAYKKGHCVISNGPLIDANLSNKRIGETAKVTQGQNILNMKMKSSEEFGELENLTIFVDGKENHEVTLSGYFSSKQIPLSLSGSEKFIILRGETNTGKIAITNPIWLDFSQGNPSPTGSCKTIKECLAVLGKKTSEKLFQNN